MREINNPTMLVRFESYFLEMGKRFESYFLEMGKVSRAVNLAFPF
jgi:hypothetical protein